MGDRGQRSAVEDRYMTDAKFHHLVDRIAQNVADKETREDRNPYQNAVAAARAAILAWEEFGKQLAHANR